MANNRTSAAMRTVLMEFKRRAYTSGNMKPRDSILIGDLLEVNEQVGIVSYSFRHIVY